MKIVSYYIQSMLFVIALIWTITALNHGCFAHGKERLKLSIAVIGDDSLTEKRAIQIAKQIKEDVDISRKKLRACEYFKKNWPTQWSTLDNLQYLKVTAHLFSDGKHCGFGIYEESHIILLREAIEELHSCMGSSTFVVAHEMLHVVGMPPHKEYETRQDYLLEDPIEKVMWWCILPEGYVRP